MSQIITSRRRNIKDLKFTDERVWITGKITKKTKEFVILDDGTDTIQINYKGPMFEEIANLDTTSNVDPVRDDGSGSKRIQPCKIAGPIEEGINARVIGDVITNTSKEIKIRPLIIQNLDELQINEDLLKKIRSLEQKLGEET